MSKKESNTSPLDLGSIIAAQTTQKPATQATQSPSNEQEGTEEKKAEDSKETTIQQPTEVAEVTTEASEEVAATEEEVTDDKEKPEQQNSNSTEWEKFISTAQKLRDKEKERKASGKKAEGDEKGIQVLVDAEVKYILDELKSKGIRIPTKHLLSAAVKVFLESNAKEVNKILGKRRKV